jgi:sugar phosphate isomerase/epimerase
MIRVALQSHLVPGGTLREKHARALEMGFDGIELQGFPMIELAEEAVRDGVPVSAMCSGHRGWFIDPDPAQVRACIDDCRRLLELGAELGAPLIVVPIYGRTQYLPAHCRTGRSPEEDEALWLAGLREVTDHAERVGGTILVEAINRYQNGVSVKVADAVRFARAMDSEQVRAMADVFHMNIEEVRVGEALRSMGEMLAYVHLSDSGRMEPGSAHLDFDEVFEALVAMGYDCWATLECQLSGPAEEVLPRALAFVRERLAVAEARDAAAPRD